jgi:hypothetical protein
LKRWYFPTVTPMAASKVVDSFVDTNLQKWICREGLSGELDILIT